jgi:trimethylamine---corrinoid protein Co-methyltransferase
MSIQMSVLGASDIERIEAQALKILAEVGVSVHNDALCAVARRHGLPVEGQVVRIPPEVVRGALRVAPQKVSLYGVNGQELPLEAGYSHLATYADALSVVDYGASAPRPSTREDVIDFVRLGQAMPEISIVNAVCYARDCPADTQLLHTVEAVMLNSDKHHNAGPLNVDDARVWVDMAEIAAPQLDLAEKPTLSLIVSPTSPLQFDRDTAEVFRLAVTRRIPFVTCSCPMAGGTAPLALAGTIVLHLAEDLFLLTLAQLMRQGTPVIIGGAAGVLDVRKGTLSYGAPERHLLLGAIIELANHYGLPHHSPTGTVDSWYPDVQAGAEKMQTWIARSASGVVFGVGLGSLMTGRAVSLEQFVIDVDLWHSANRLFQGLDTTDLEESFEVIRRVGHGGSYLDDPQTLRLMRGREVYHSDIVNRDGPEGADMLARAHRKVERILATHRYAPVPEVVDGIARYVAQHRRA